MNEAAVDLWSSTMTAQAYSGLQDISLGRYLISLLLVLAVLMLAAWLVRRAGWFQTVSQKPDIAEPEDKLLFYTQFNSEQTLMVVEQKQTIYCYIMKGKQTQLATPLPGLVVKPEHSHKTAKPSQSFQAFWLQALGKKRGKN